MPSWKPGGSRPGVFVDFPSEELLFHSEGSGFGDWGYHELTYCGGEFLRHEVSFSSGAMLLFEVKQLEVQCEHRSTGQHSECVEQTSNHA